MKLSLPSRVYVVPARDHGSPLKYRVVVDSFAHDPAQREYDYFDRINELTFLLAKWKGHVIVADDLDTRIGFDHFEDLILFFTHITNGGEI